MTRGHVMTTERATLIVGEWLGAPVTNLMLEATSSDRAGAWAVTAQAAGRRGRWLILRHEDQYHVYPVPTR